jgi:hypothetical protein
MLPAPMALVRQLSNSLTLRCTAFAGALFVRLISIAGIQGDVNFPNLPVVFLIQV